MDATTEIVVERRDNPPHVRKRKLGAAMAGGNPGALAHRARERNAYDRYVTPDDGTRALLHAFGHHIKGVVWEPCAGQGHMAVHLRRHPGVTKLLASDRWPPPREDCVENLPVAKLDVFASRAAAKPRFNAIITNPPFDIAADIIQHILTVGEPEVTFFAVLLKATYWHAQERQALFRDLPPSIIAPLTFRLDFEGLGRPVMECAWNIWINGNVTTLYQPIGRAP